MLQSLRNDGFNQADSEKGAQQPTELAKLPGKESLLKALEAQMQKVSLGSVAFVDLDNFKQVNDQHGHSEGDKCLAEVVACLSAVILGKGSVYRVGGDEFCVLLSNFSSYEAAATAERLRLNIDALKPFGGTTKVTASIGVAASDAKGLAGDAESLVRAADEAMYVSKWIGKNRVTIWPGTDADRKTAQDNRDRIKTHRQTEQPPERQEARNEKGNRRKEEMKNALAILLAEAQTIRNSVEYNNPASVFEKADWERRAGEYLTKHLDQSFAVRFRSPKLRTTTYPDGMSKPMRAPWAELTARMEMLHDFIAELRE